MGHARALLALDSPSQQLKIFEQIRKNGISVRQVEELVKKLKNGEDVRIGNKKISSNSSYPTEFKILREQLANFFHTKISLSITPSGKGKISIPFANEEELEHIISVFDNMKQK